MSRPTRLHGWVCFFSLASVIERQRHGKKAEQWMSCQERPDELQLPVRVVVCLVLLDNTIVQLSKLICKIQPKNNHHLITAEHLTAELLVVSCQQWPIDSRSVCMCLLKIYYNSILQALALVRSDCWGPLGPGPDLGPLGLSGPSGAVCLQGPGASGIHPRYIHRRNEDSFPGDPLPSSFSRRYEVHVSNA